MKIGVVGAGYVGLTTGICLASLKHKISIFDVDEEKLEQIRKKNPVVIGSKVTQI